MTVLGKLSLGRLTRGDYFEEHEVFSLTGFGGQVTLVAGTKAVTFTFPQPDTSFYITLSGDANETFYWSAKATTGFTITSSNGASTAKVDWHVQR